MTTSFLAALQALLDPAGILTDETALAGYCLDQRRRYRGQALAVARPRSCEEVAAVVRLCAEHGVPIVPQGGNTGNCGAATPDESGSALILSLERMNRILEVDADNNTITVETGVILADAQAAARAAGRLLAADWAAAASCQIGGALAVNAGGVNVLRYGNMREQTLGLEVVLASGEIWGGLRALRKDNTGYDLKQLFIGAEGTLGIITRAVLRLFPLPTAQALALVAFPDPDAALALLRDLQGRVGDRVTSFELIGQPCLELLAKHFPQLPQPFSPAPQWLALIELSDCGDSAELSDKLIEALAESEIEDAVLARNAAESEALWRLREEIAEAQRREGVSIKHDISLPVSRVPAFLAECGPKLQAEFPDAQIVAFGHLGDGNLHYNVFRADKSQAAYQAEAAINAIVYGCVTQLGGSISAEHGIGQLKVDALTQYRSKLELDLMRGIKQLLDPQNLMNPGKVLRF
ncbi:FAD/FMN-containing dehydrogenase [Formivibrio citricus]|uniref:FAD/FMN-containing dehydrogenase n=1 Tax=Formivibrio citricus TaxID=83765 RepID=A0A1I5C480_9NEIS|nr:FAD-binding oxidoreductase [Formivibrio citricus]SFN81737.1 FAD/FMN-containing dehydrogenase [Formivibrio citricus]